MGDLIEEQTKEQLGNFASKFGPKVIVPAKVTAVDSSNDTVEIEFSDGATVDDARLRSVVKAGNKVVMVPKVGSIVQVGRIENSDEWLVIAVEEITAIKYVIGSVSFLVDENGFVIKKGTDTLWDAAKLLFEALEIVVILQGTNIDMVKLLAAKNKFKDILNGT